MQAEARGPAQANGQAKQLGRSPPGAAVCPECVAPHQPLLRVPTIGWWVGLRVRHTGTD